MTSLDEQRLREALVLAESSIGLTEPNPRVGCILGFADGRIIGRGATQQAGGPHAEVVALRDAQSQGLSTRGATAWVTLEPCAHHGRTPPCCDALIEAGLGRVVAAVADPFPQVNGAGFDRLRARGVQVSVAGGDLAAAARSLNVGFFSRVERGMPWVRMKVAASLDGTTALSNGKSQWITSEAARRDGHLWRRRSSAVLTGIGTALADDPQLTVRAIDTPFQPKRVLVDSQLRLPPSARLLNPPGEVLIFSARTPAAADEALLAYGAEVLKFRAASGRVDLAAMMRELARRGINEVLVEAGASLNGALLQANLVDEVLLYLAPSLLGHGQPVAMWPALSELSEGVQLRFDDIQLLGPDLRIRAAVQRLPGA